MFELKNVSKFYQTNGVVSSALHHINLSLSKGEIVAITGESGSGKSTLLNVITKMDNFDEGEIYYYGNETSYFSINDMDDFRKNKVGFIFQNYNIIDSYTVLENVMLPLLLKGMKRIEAKKRAIELIEEVGLSHRIKNRGIKLSGGEKQRCVIARALASDCEILACDEPTGNLDAKTAADIIELIKKVSKDKLVLIVTHDFEQVKDIVTRKIKIMDGEIIEDTGVSKEIFNEENQDLNLDYQPQSKKISLVVAKNNLLYTPKKTLLVGAILLVICLFVLFLYQTIYTSYTEIDDGSVIPYQSEDKMLVATKNKVSLKEEDVMSLSDHVLFNRFYEKKSFYFESNDYLFSFPAYYEPEPSNLQMDEGRLPENSFEVGLLIPAKGYAYNIDSRIIDKIINIPSYDYSKEPFSLKVTGYQKREDVTEPILFGNKDLEKRYRCEALNEHFKITIEYSKNQSKFNESVQLELGFGKTRLVVPASYEDVSISTSLSSLNGYQFSLSEMFPIEKSTNVIASPVLIYGDDEPFMDEKYEAYVYGDISKLAKKAENLNLNVINFSTYTDTQPLFIFLMNVQIYVLILLSSMVIIVIYFITYVILSRIYQARKKDYTVLRTLGVTKRDMKSVVTFEVMIQTILMAVLVYLVCFILGKTVSSLYVFSKIPFYITALYFVVMLLFGYIMARRFNRRLFKYSVNQTFKSEVN